MSGKYRDLLKGDAAPKSALQALSRKVSKVESLTNKMFAEANAEKTRQAAAAAARDDMDRFVTRAELLEAIESGEPPQAWITAPAAAPAPAADPED